MMQDDEATALRAKTPRRRSYAAHVHDIKHAVELRFKMIEQAEAEGRDQMEVGVEAEKAIVLAAQLWLIHKENSQSKSKP